MAQFEEKALFGGAITGAAPQGWIDGSTVREIPDHQELFLSSTTLSNLIFEVNEYVTKQQALSTLSAVASPDLAPRTGGIHADADAEGIAAATYHLRDLCDEEDAIDVINAPRRVQLKKLTSPAAKDNHHPSAFSGLVKFTTPRKQRRGSAQLQRQNVSFISVDASGGSSSSISPSAATDSNNSTQSCHFLLVRLPEKETDLLVFVNVPHDEFDLQGDPRALAKEEDLACGLIQKFVEVLDIKDWSLFG
ncbi:hypothetical protein UA08_03795 [Talaromyces atroroseus]|uniref:Ran-interacting protein Mog1 n=1 Tax=Talaromyces atroroseus TaxID=1441469 RepID=A0A225ANP2_TALAT|nr:hypothetical protein UA08_03795 [Talaromyces atroroseus]OKL61083.1 hypothetical protein UA08_03795 [Talaromyces atroroseus]